MHRSELLESYEGYDTVPIIGTDLEDQLHDMWESLMKIQYSDSDNGHVGSFGSGSKSLSNNANEWMDSSGAESYELN